jgi:hypothetical protein
MSLANQIEALVRRATSHARLRMTGRKRDKFIEPSSVCAPGCQSMTSQTGEDRPYRGYLADVISQKRAFL